ncbi:glycoside hydrolase family 88 protein [Paenibacillus thalictri]|uniref:Glucuronyl hydrolase n=1 Tax=Paenibacillus thalictri TaxID=2527873 RepID=A0A4Q9DPJ2_9BACL|nr:glycoside hydrolase family 88 protein [Paenibacillus thalictri]TBL76061.1 glucuronyl hydrolase [Paenibacillus thalictri]
MRQISYLPASRVISSEAQLPEGKSIARGWSAVQVGEGNGRMELEWRCPDGGGPLEPKRATMEGSPAEVSNPNSPLDLSQGDGQGVDGISRGSRLRITVALDYRDAQQVEVTLRQSNVTIGAIDIRYAYVFQPFELALTAEQTAAVLSEGLCLTLRGGSQPLWVFDTLDGVEERVLFAPHLLIGEPESHVEEAMHTMLSLSSLQPFGWMEGCVLDGLHSLRALLGDSRVDPALDLHFRQFFNDRGDLLYEDLHGQKADGTFTTIEATLPVAVIAQYRPEHPVIDKAVAFFKAKGMKDGKAVVDDDMVSAEGSYTVAYPLAVIAKRRGRKDLAEQAIAQVLLRRDCLARDRHVYLRYMMRSQEHTFRSWARAFAWYCLGLVKTCSELLDSPFAQLAGMGELQAEIARIAQVAADWRQPGGLWSCFLDDASTGIDTSGSAGISAALALAARRGLLPASYMELARDNLQALSVYLTPDGLMSGVAQHNAGGMELQRSGYRVISQMGLGLWTQLYAQVNAERQPE